MKTLNRDKIQRMFGQQAGGAGGSSVNDDGDGVSKLWVEQNYLSKEFFLRLFNIHGEDENDDPVDVQPNDLETTITDIEAMFGFWTEQYLSALGQNSDQGGGGITLNAALASINNSPLGNPTGTNTVLMFNGTTWVYASMGSTDMNTVWTALAAATNQQINISHLTTALSGYATTSQLSDYATVTDLEQLASYFNTLSGYFTNGAANEAVKLETARTIWGQQFDGTANITGDITQATCLEFSGIAGTATNGGFIDFHYAGGGADYTSRIIEDVSGVLKINNTIWAQLSGNVSIGTSTISQTYKLDVAGYTKTTRLYLADGVYLEYDSTNSGVHLVGAGFYSDSYVSALGVNSGGGGGGSDYIPLTGSDQIAGSLIPVTTNAYDLGDSTHAWRNIRGNSIYASNSLTTYYLTANSTVTAVGSITSTAGYVSAAAGFKIPNGTSSQFLKADGSVDSNIYGLLWHSDEFSFLPSGFSGNQVWINYRTLGNNATGNISTYNFMKGTAGATASAFANILAGGFIIINKDDNYVVLAGGGSTKMKTINGYSLFGEGNIDASGGGTGSYVPIGGGTMTGMLKISTSSYGIQLEINRTTPDGNPSIKFTSGVGDGTTYNPFYYLGFETSAENTHALYYNVNNTTDKYYVATLASDNNLVNHGDEFTFLPSGFSSNQLWINYRTCGNNATQDFIYRFCNGHTDSGINGYASICAKSFIILNGTSSQFLKADGSVDNHTYITAESLTGYVSSITINGGSAIYPTNGTVFLTNIALQASDNNLINYGDEFTFLPSGFSSNNVWINYRTCGNNATGDFTYLFANGKKNGGYANIAVKNITTTKNITIGDILEIKGKSLNINRLIDGSIQDNTKNGFEIESYTSNVSIKTFAGTSTTSSHIVFIPSGTSNVGIGTTSPSEKLDVNGNAKFAGYLTGVTNVDSLLYFDTTNTRVGIDKSSPAYTLDVNGNLGVVSGITLTSTKKITFGTGANAPYIEVGSDGYFHFSVGVYSDGFVSALGLNSGGGGGAADYIPLSGSTSITGDLTPSSNNSVNLGSSSKLWAGVYCTNLRAYGASSIAGNLSLAGSITPTTDQQYSLGTESLRFAGLFVHGRIYLSGMNIQYLSAGSGVLGGYHFQAGSSDIILETSGYVWQRTTSQYYSDIRRKNIVSYIDTPVDKIANAPIFTFTWKDFTGNMQQGSSAQYWRDVLPNGVAEASNGTLGMDYATTALISAVITARKVVDHEARIRLLEVENAALRNEINQLKKVA